MFPTGFADLPLIAILRGITPDEAVAVASVLYEVGFRCIEVPLNSPEPFESIRRIADVVGRDCLVGAGTVLTANDVAQVRTAGGRLIVMPHSDASVIRVAKDAGMVCAPGVSTLTEAFAALDAGADALKVFPAELITPPILRAWRSVLPRTVKLIPVGGISPESMRSFVSAGASGFGLGGNLYSAGNSAESVRRSACQFAMHWHGKD
ncbi:MAG: 2-dehydro-3-deoxy-6-phosphogalactonate aldolase [Dyella sp.]|nr:2-dehydro-3-deoxy-6-phosphogalactonate aldolase [Dyella sp.]